MFVLTLDAEDYLSIFHPGSVKLINTLKNLNTPDINPLKPKSRIKDLTTGLIINKLKSIEADNNIKKTNSNLNIFS